MGPTAILSLPARAQATLFLCRRGQGWVNMCSRKAGVLFAQVDILGTRAFSRWASRWSISLSPSIISPGAPSLPSPFPMERQERVAAF